MKSPLRGPALSLRLGLTLSLLGFALTLLPAIAAAHGDLPPLPKPTEPYEQTRARLEAEGLWQPSGLADRTPPPDPQVGDTWLWYVWDLGGYPVADLKPCTVRGMGDHCYVVVDDEEWNVGMNQTDVDRIVDHFDNVSVGNWPTQGIWDLNTSHFGDPPNPLDGLDRIFLFYYRFNISADGFFWYFDQYPDGSQPFHSNECEVVYLAVEGGGSNPAGDYMLAVGAHEFEHMIHFARDQNEDTWLDEGLGELAMWLFGHPDNISSFNTQPDNPLTDWGSSWADYIQCYLWSLYAYEQFGGQPFIWDLIHNTANGMASFQATLDAHAIGLDTEDVFQNWSVANFLDDTSIPDGQYGYYGETLPPFLPWRTHSTYPASSPGSVGNWAAEYVRLTDLGGGAPTVDFDGADNRTFRVSLMALDDTLPTLVRFMTLDGTQNGSFDFVESAGYDEVVLGIANVYPYQAGSYSYTVDLLATEAPAGATAATTLAANPNPFNPRTQLRFTLPEAGRARLSVHDLRGREVAVLGEGIYDAGSHEITWQPDGLASGLYLARIAVDGETEDMTKLVLIK